MDLPTARPAAASGRARPLSARAAGHTGCGARWTWEGLGHFPIDELEGCAHKPTMNDLRKAIQTAVLLCS